MSKKRSHVVAQPKSGKNVITISLSEKEKIASRRAASRQSEIDAGMVRRSGAGTHGGGQRAETRRERRKSNQDLRRGSFD